MKDVHMKIHEYRPGVHLLRGEDSGAVIISLLAERGPITVDAETINTLPDPGLVPVIESLGIGKIRVSLMTREEAIMKDPGIVYELLTALQDLREEQDARQAQPEPEREQAAAPAAKLSWTPTMRGGSAPDVSAPKQLGEGS